MMSLLTSRLSVEAKEKKHFLNFCQEAGLLEVLPYHECDLMSRDLPNYLTCLVRLQVQNISARYPVFITGETLMHRYTLHPLSLMILWVYFEGVLKTSLIHTKREGFQDFSAWKWPCYWILFSMQSFFKPIKILSQIDGADGSEGDEYHMRYFADVIHPVSRTWNRSPRFGCRLIVSGWRCKGFFSCHQPATADGN